MRKPVIFLLIISIISSICYGVVAEETHTYKIEGYENTYVDGDFIYDADTDKIIAYAGNNGDIIIPENATVAESFGFVKRGILSCKTDTHIIPRKIIISKGVKIEGTISIYACTKNLETVEFYNNTTDMPDVRVYFGDGEKLKTLRLPDGLTKIENGLCENYENLEEIYIPESVTVIEKEAFYNCKSIKNIELPENLIEIGDSAFYGCKVLENVKFGSKIQKIGNSAFEKCSELKNADLPDSVTEIGEKAFFGCSAMKNFTFPSSIKTLKKDALSNCGVTRWYYPENIDYLTFSVIKDVENVEFEKEPEKNMGFYQHFRYTEWMKEKIIPELGVDFLILDGYLIQYYGKEKNIVIPDEVHTIGNAAFSQQGIESVEFHNNITKIEDYAFYLCDLSEVIIPKSVREIGSYAFSECNKLENIVFEGDCLLQDYAFYNCQSIRDSGITVNGNLIYEKNTDPFMFTDTSYAIERWHWGNEKMLTTQSPTQSPEPSENPTATPTEKPTENPSEQPTEVPTKEPQQTPIPQEKEVIKVVSENNALSIFADEKEIEFTDELPFIDNNGRTQTPIRAVGEALGCNVDWNESKRNVTLTKGDLVVTITIDSNKMTVGGKEIEMDTTAKIIGERTYIPLRFAGEALGFNVEWVVK